MKSGAGFTLVELLIVVAIIGVLSVVGLTAYGNVQQKARDTKRKADIDAIAKVMESKYNVRTNSYPVVNSVDLSSLTSGLPGNQIPVSPRSDDYSLSTDGKAFVVCSKMDNAPATLTAQQCIASLNSASGTNRNYCYCKTSLSASSQNIITAATTGTYPVLNPGMPPPLNTITGSGSNYTFVYVCASPISTPSPISASQTINLNFGWNYIGLTVEMGCYMASQLYNDLGGGSGGITEITGDFDATSFGISHIAYCPDGCPASTVSRDFPITLGRGYAIRALMDSPRAVTITGSQASLRSLNLVFGYNLVTFADVPTSINTIGKLGNSIHNAGGNISEIDSWRNGSWAAWIYGPSFNSNLPVSPGVGYYIRMNSAFNYPIPIN